MKHAEANSNRQNVLVIAAGVAASVALALSVGPIMAAVGAPQDRVVAQVAKVRPEAAGVNEGTKKQAAGIVMHAPASLSSKQLEAQVGKYGPHGGCVPGYGQGKRCLTPVSPAAAAMSMSAEQMPWECFQVRALFPKGLPLDAKGVDPLGLDRNHDDVACGSGD